MTSLTVTELRDLETYRLMRRWSFRQLGEDMGLPEATITRILQTKRPRIHDTTAYAIRTYLHGTVRAYLNQKSHNAEAAS